MSKVRGTREEEFDKVIALINKIFRLNLGYEPTMHEEFPLLLAKDNIDNMRIIEEGDIPVACVNFIKKPILIEGAKINTASIGAVCTLKEYRGKGYSSLILDDVESKMFDDDIDLALVSGTRALYQRRGYTMTKNFKTYKVLPENCDLDFEIREYENIDLENIMKLYNKVSTRFYRTKEDFKTLIKSAMFPWGDTTYKAYVIEKHDLVVAYAFVRISNEIEKVGSVVEALGNSIYIEKALKYIAFNNELKEIEYRVHKLQEGDFLNSVEGFDDYQEGSLKIINFERFMNNLKPYFSQYVENKILDKITFKVKNNYGNKRNENIYKPIKDCKVGVIEFDDFKINVSEDVLEAIEVMEENRVYTFTWNEEILEIYDIRTLNKLVFEGLKSVDIDFDHRENIKEFMEKVFPIPFIYVKNLNYQ